MASCWTSSRNQTALSGDGVYEERRGGKVPRETQGSGDLNGVGSTHNDVKAYVNMRYCVKCSRQQSDAVVSMGLLVKGMKSFPYSI